MSSSAPRDTTAFEVREALGRPGCVVCQLALRSVQRQIRTIAYEQVNDIDLRARLRRARGFCNAHAHQWLREARNVLGTALIYRDVLRATLEELESGRRGGLLQGLFGSEREAVCPVCEAQQEAEARYVAALVGLVAADAAARSAFESADGLCRVHVLAALRVGGPGAEAIVAYTRQRVEALVRELDEVIRKEDYRFRHEPRTEAERSAPQRAIAWAAGIDGLTQ
jgi:hypothetical protein